MQNFLKSLGANDVIDKSFSILRTKNRILDALIDKYGREFVHKRVTHKKLFMAPELITPIALELPKKEEDFFKVDEFPLLDLERACVEKAFEVDGEAEKKEYILPLLQLMLDTTFPKARIEITKGRTENDWKEVARVAHRMKGSVLYVATRLAYSSFYLEAYYKSLDEPSIPHMEKLYKQCLRVMEQTEKALREIAT